MFPSTSDNHVVLTRRLVLRFDNTVRFIAVKFLAKWSPQTVGQRASGFIPIVGRGNYSTPRVGVRLFGI